MINDARLRKLSRRKEKVTTFNAGATVKQHSIIDFSLSRVVEERNKRRKHNDSIDREVNSRSKLHLLQTQFSFPIIDGDVSWHEAFAFEEFEGEEGVRSIWSKTFPIREILDQNFVGVSDLAKLEKVGFSDTYKALQHIGVGVGVMSCLME